MSAAPGLRELTTEQCWSLLAAQDVGRLGVIAEHYPMIFPVNYAVDHEVVVVRTGPGTKLTAASHANVGVLPDRVPACRRPGPGGLT